MIVATRQRTELCGWILRRQTVPACLDDEQTRPAKDGQHRGSTNGDKQYIHEFPACVYAERWGIADSVEEQGDARDHHEKANTFYPAQLQQGHPFGLRPMALVAAVLSAHCDRRDGAQKYPNWDETSCQTLKHASTLSDELLSIEHPLRPIVLVERVLVNRGDGKTACYAAASGGRSNRP